MVHKQRAFQLQTGNRSAFLAQRTLFALPASTSLGLRLTVVVYQRDLLVTPLFDVEFSRRRTLLSSENLGGPVNTPPKE